MHCFRYLLPALLLLVVAREAIGQDIRMGVRAGLNWSTLDGPLETGDTGKNLEDYSWNTGFHVGITVSWELSELMGLRSEFFYSQEGVKRSYDGPSYYVFRPLENPIYATGNANINLDVTNSHLSIPVLVYGKPLPWLELFAGGRFGLIVASTAFGDIEFAGTASNGTAVELRHELDFRYFSDRTGQGIFLQPINTVTISGEQVPYPHTGRAYFLFSESRGKLYRSMNFSLEAGLSVYTGRSLYLSGRVLMGLTDLTKEKADISWKELDSDKQFISRKDKDTALAIQLSVGFKF